MLKKWEKLILKIIIYATRLRGLKKKTTENKLSIIFSKCLKIMNYENNAHLYTTPLVCLVIS